MLTLNALIRYRWIIILLLAGQVAYGQNQNQHFQRITINDGLSLSSVYCIFQDSKGFMWFGTEDGLNKYDGTNFFIYNHRSGEKNSLSHRWIEQIAEDKGGFLWLGSRNGLTRLDPTTDEMSIYSTSRPGQFSLTNDTITVLYYSDKFIWAGTQSGLNRINGKTLKSEKLYPGDDPGNCKIQSIYEDKKGRTWIGSSNGLFVNIPGYDNLVRVDLSTKNTSVQSILTDKDTLWIGSQDGLTKYILDSRLDVSFRYPGIKCNSERPITNIYKDSRSKMWIQTSDGLFTYTSNNQLNQIIRSSELSPSLSVKPFKPLLEDKEGDLWFGTFGSGIYKISVSQGLIQHYQHNPANNSSISDNTINCLMEDRSGAVWIGTFGAGISIYIPHANIIETLKHNAFDQNSMTSSFVWSIMEDNTGKIWIGTNQTGINIYDPKERKFTYYNHDPYDPTSLPNPSVREIFQSSNGTIWIGTDGGGLSKFNQKTGNFTTYTNSPSDPSTISNNSVRTIFEDTTGILWIGTRNGLNRFNTRKGVFKRYLHNPQDENSISNNFIYSSIYMDRRGQLWIGTYGGGLNVMDPATENFKSYQFDQSNPSSISDNIIFSIYEDNKGYFWIGTNSGLNLLNPSTEKFKRYGIDDGLPNEVIYGIMPDYQNRLWMTTNKGISRLDLTEFEFKNFDVKDGLQSNEFNGGAYFFGKSGKIYAGGVYGMNIIDPEKIVPVKNSAEIIISRLEILGKEVSVAPEGIFRDSDEGDQQTDQLIEIVDNYYLPIHVTYLNEIKLNYRQRFFSIEFTALNHHMPEKLNYRYRMGNLEEGWTNSGNRNYVTYANMKPGIYTFEVNASNSDGFYTNYPAKLKIIITPPFWRKYWFMILEALFLIGIAIFIYRYLLNQRTNKILKEQYGQIKKAHEQLQISENNLKELNATKDRFFSIISHDLKNPFASVLSISELLDVNFDITQHEELKYGVSKIHQTNQHIYNLLENLLTWSRSQRGKLVVDKARFNLSKTIETNINLIKLAAEKKKIELRTEIEEEIFAYADREMISTVIRNLLTNAVKFTESGKSITVKVEPNEVVTHVHVIDEGIGIGSENIEKLFQIEDKIKTEGTAGEKGTGLGLIICKEFIELNHGTIHVNSSPGKGSTFSFTLPKSDPEA